jgi:hypothetical protein
MMDRGPGPSVRLAVVLVGVLVGVVAMTGCRPGSGDEDAQEQGLRDSRDQTVTELTAALGTVTAGLPAQLRFSQGNYDTCRSDLEGATGYAYSVNGRLDLATAPTRADLTRLARLLTEAAFEAEVVDDLTVEGTKSGLTLSLSRLDQEPAYLFSGGTDECFEIGRDRADAYSVDKDPIQLG